MTPEERRRRLLAGALFFAPWRKLRFPVALAAHDLDDYFVSVDLALDSATVAGALRGGEGIGSVIGKLVSASMLGGYQDGAALSGRGINSHIQRDISSRAAERGDEVQGLITDTSRKWLKDDPNHTFALSSERAERAAKYEAARGYYAGLGLALRGANYGKAWITTSDEPCEECLDNEDSDVIGMEEEFPSGDDFPPMHLNCACVIELVRL